MSAIVIAGAVPPDVVAKIRARMQSGAFISGKTTAVGRAKAIKDNLVLTPDSPAAEEAI